MAFELASWIASAGLETNLRDLDLRLMRHTFSFRTPQEEQPGKTER